MKNKKIFRLLFLTLLVALTLTSCKKESEKNNNGGNQQIVDTTKPVYTISFSSFEYTEAGRETIVTMANSILLNEGMTIPNLPVLQERNGLSFDGWFLEYSLTTPFFYEQMPAGNLQLFARWANSSSRLYVSPNGVRTNDGTRNSPLDVDTAVRTIKAGGTVQFLEGRYMLRNTLVLSASGNANAKTSYIGAATGNGVILDFSQMVENDSNVGIKVCGNYNIIKNFTVYNAGDNGMLLGSSNNLVENCVFEKNRDTGLQISRFSGSYQPNIDNWPSNNIILNCTSFNNEDSSGENADGFAAKLTVGENNVFDGCIAYWNIDDGWDLYAKVDSGSIGLVKIINSISYENGCVLRDDGTFYTPPSGADGNGFKLGGSGVPGQVVVENSIAAYNYTMGFTDNSNPGVISIKNCTSYNNGQKGNQASKEYDNFNLNRDGVKKNRNYYANLLSYYDDDYKPSNENETFGSNLTRKSDEFNGSIINSILYYAENKSDTSTPYYISGPTVLQNDAYFKQSKYVSQYTYSNGIFAQSGSLESKISIHGNNLHKGLRNEDGSFNLGDLWKIDTTKLGTIDSTNIGANLSKSSSSDYSHITLSSPEANETKNQAVVREIYDALDLAINNDIVYNDIKLVTRINGVDITWTSSDSTKVSIKTDSTGQTYATPIVQFDRDTTITLTATISYENETKTKTFTYTNKKFDSRIGEITGIENYTILNTDETPNYKSYKVYDYTTTSLVLEENNHYTTSIKIMFRSEAGTTKQVAEVGKEVGTYTITYSFTLDGYDPIVKTSTVTVRDSDAAISILSVKSPLGYVIDNTVNVIGTVSYNTGTLYGVIINNTSNAPTAEQIKDAAVNQASLEGLISTPIAYNITKLNFDVTLELNSNYVDETAVQVYLVVDHSNNGLGNVMLLENILPTEFISTPQELTEALTNASNSKKAYKLANNIDMTGITWTQSEESSSTFTGYFDGAFYTISNLNISVTGTEKEGGGGLFFKLAGATVKNLTLEKFKVTSTGGRVAVLAGVVKGGNTTITNIQIINCYVLASERAGGLIGEYKGDSSTSNLLISNIVITSDTSNINYAIKSDGGKYVGGIVAHVQFNATAEPQHLIVENIYVSTMLIGNNQFVGGIIGRIDTRAFDSTILVRNALFTGAIKNSSSYSGGIVGGRQSGDLTIENCISSPIENSGSGSGLIISTQMCIKLGIAPNFYYEINEAIKVKNIITLIPDLLEDEQAPDPNTVYPPYDGERHYMSEFKNASVWESYEFDLTNIWKLDTSSGFKLILRAFDK